MKASELDLRELLQFEPGGGLLRFGGQRALLFDAVALGILRRELITGLGLSAARGVLTRFGYAHGWRTAEALKAAFPWDDEAEWKRAGGRLHALQGLVVVETPSKNSSSKSSSSERFAEAIWHESYEAEQHLLHLGRAEEPVCWTLAGFASGYLSYCNGREIYCIEERCCGKGDAVCTLVGRAREDWGPAISPHLPYYEKQCVDQVLAQVTAELRRVEQRLRVRRKALGEEASAPEGLAAQSEAMRRVIELAQRVAKVDSTVLITGESGVGKERLARLIHDESTRAGGPFVAINCGAVPEPLLESELFGHAKGAFTGAASDRAGLFEAASGGTLFLDELGEVPPSMQVKLLRALQEREVRRVGENQQRKVDVRVLAATNRDLVAEVHAARFRQDLYYRVRVVELRVPPLRERQSDILALARTFQHVASQRMQRKCLGFSPAAAQRLLQYGWPGNVRELENAMERAVALCTGPRIEVEDLPEEVGLAIGGVVAASSVRPLHEIERDYIQAAVRANGGNKAAAAEQLGIGIATLYRKLKQYESASG